MDLDTIKKNTQTFILSACKKTLKNFKIAPNEKTSEYIN